MTNLSTRIKSLFFKDVPVASIEKRSVNGTVTMKDGLAWFKAMGMDLGDIPVTTDSVMGMSAFYACVDLISSSLATPSLKVYLKKSNGDREEVTNHPVTYLVGFRPNRLMSSTVWRKTMATHLLVFGNAVSQVIRGENNRPIEIKILLPKDYAFLDTADRLIIQLKDGTILQEEDYIHWKDLSFDGKVGVSKVQLTKKGLKTQLTAEEFLSKYYEKGTFTNGFLKVQSKPDKATLDMISQTWDDNYGGIGNAFNTPTLPLGTDYVPLTKSPVESQMMEFLSFAPTKIYQTFRVPPHMVSDMTKSTSFGKGIEDLSILYLTHTILPYAVQFEQECNYKLFRKSEHQRYSVKLNLRSLERAGFADQMQGFGIAIQNGIYNPNDARKYLDKNAYEGGETYMVNGNMIGVKQVPTNAGNYNQNEGAENK